MLNYFTDLKSSGRRLGKPLCIVLDENPPFTVSIKFTGDDLILSKPSNIYFIFVCERQGWPNNVDKVFILHTVQDPGEERWYISPPGKDGDGRMRNRLS